MLAVYIEFAERFNGPLLRAFNEAGIAFAFPSQTVYVEGDGSGGATVAA
jgi:hypothetical protein